MDGFGCWFYPLLPPYSRGTGIFINTGRSVWLHDREAAQAYFAISGQSTGTQLPAPDAKWAARAHAMGLDSVQLEHGPDGMPEMIVTTPACLSQPKPIETCPPIELRTGYDASRNCRCSDRLAVLNCDNNLDVLDFV